MSTHTRASWLVHLVSKMARMDAVRFSSSCLKSACAPWALSDRLRANSAASKLMDALNETLAEQKGGGQ